MRWLAAPMALAAGLAGAGAMAQTVTELRVMVPRTSAETRPLFEAVAAEFEAAHPDVDIQVEVVGWESLFQALTADLSAGTPPDLAVVATRWLADLVADGAVEPLDGRMDAEMRGRFIPALLAPTTLEGKLWGLPIAASVRALYVNQDLFGRAAIASAPATWEELEVAAGEIVALGDGIYGFGLQGSEIETDVYFYYALWAEGGEIVRGDGSSGLGADPAIAAAEMYRRFIDEGLVQPDVTACGREDLQDLFAAGRLGMLIAAPPFAAQLAAEAPGLSYEIAPIPAGVEQATFGVTDSIVMFRGSEAKDAAWAFLQLLFQPRWRAEFAAKDGLLPTTVAAEGGAVDPALAPFAALLPQARFTPTTRDWEVIADLTSNALQRIYLGELSPREALTAAAAEIDGVLGR